MSDKPHIIIMGAGAVGGWFGSQLAKSDACDVTFIARGSHLEKLRENAGITIHDTTNPQPTSEFIEVRSQSVQTPLKRNADWILMCVKSMDTKEAINQIRPWMNSETQILTIQNGLENYESLHNEFGESKVIRGLCRIGAELTKPGEITYRGLGEIIFGEETGTESSRIINLKSVFDQANISSKVSQDITKESWLKFLWNAVFNMITGITATTTDHIYAHEESLSFARQLAAEVQKSAQSIDRVYITDEEISKIFHQTKKLGAFKTSTYQDRIKNKPLEYDTFCGYLIRKADSHDLHLPGFAYLFALYVMLD